MIRGVGDQPSGISRSGREAERRFMAITGARATDRAELGDAVLNGVTVEIKQTQQAGTLNQVRAVKYLPLAVWGSDILGSPAAT